MCRGMLGQVGRGEQDRLLPQDGIVRVEYVRLAEAGLGVSHTLRGPAEGAPVGLPGSLVRDRSLRVLAQCYALAAESQGGRMCQSCGVSFGWHGQFACNRLLRPLDRYECANVVHDCTNMHQTASTYYTSRWMEQSFMVNRRSGTSPGTPLSALSCCGQHPPRAQTPWACPSVARLAMALLAAPMPTLR